MSLFFFSLFLFFSPPPFPNFYHNPPSTTTFFRSDTEAAPEHAPEEPVLEDEPTPDPVDAVQEAEAEAEADGAVKTEKAAVATKVEEQVEPVQVQKDEAAGGGEEEPHEEEPASDAAGSSPASRKRPASDDGDGEKDGDAAARKGSVNDEGDKNNEDEGKEEASDDDDDDDDDDNGDDDADDRRGSSSGSYKRRRQSEEGGGKAKVSEVKQKLPIEREKVCPMLLRVFPRPYSHFTPADFANGRTPRNELNMHTWMDCTFKELSRLVGAGQASARKRGTRFEFANVVHNGDRTYIRQFASVANGYVHPSLYAYLSVESSFFSFFGFLFQCQRLKTNAVANE